MVIMASFHSFEHDTFTTFVIHSLEDEEEESTVHSSMPISVCMLI